MLRYCLEDDEERYGDILDKLDEAEGIDRNIKEKRSFTRKLLDFMMLSEFFGAATEGWLFSKCAGVQQ